MDINFEAFNLKTIFSILAIVIWIIYIIFAFTIAGKTNVLSKVLKTNLGPINRLAAWLHLFLVIFVGLIGIILIIA